MVLVSTRPLKAGEAICEFYNGCTFFGYKKEKRQSMLLEEHHFICDCIPCLEDWPQSNDVYWKKEVKFCCSVCSSKFGPDERRRENFQKIILNSRNNFKCSSCKLKHSEKELREKLRWCEKTIEVSENLIDAGFGIKVFKSLKEVGQFLEFNIIPPSMVQLEFEDCLAKAIRLNIFNIE